MFTNLVDLIFGLSALAIFFILPFALIIYLMKRKYKKRKSIEEGINNLPEDLRQKAQKDQNNKFIISLRSSLALVGVVSIAKHYYEIAFVAFFSLALFELLVWYLKKKSKKE